MKLNNPPKESGKYSAYTFTNFDLPEYNDFISIRQLPDYNVEDRTVTFQSQYLDTFISEGVSKLPLSITDDLFDYQKVIVKVAFMKQRYALFADAGMGKTLCLGELGCQIHAKETGKILFVIPLNIIVQFEEMVKEFFDDFPEFVHLHNNKEMSLKEWAVYDNVPRVGFVNHEAFIKSQDYLTKYLDCLIVDESSILKGGAGGNGKIRCVTQAMPCRTRACLISFTSSTVF